VSTSDQAHAARTDVRAEARVLHANVLREVERLGGRLPEAFEARDRVVETAAGPHSVPPSVQALLAVVWPEGEQLRTTDEFDFEVRFVGFEVGAGLVVEDRPRAWYGVRQDSGQWFLLVDLAEAAEAAGGLPRVYHVDHEGGEPAPSGEFLDSYMFDLRRSSPVIDLGRACVRGDTSDVRRRFGEGVGTGSMDDSGLTPLHLAVVSCSVECIQTLLTAGSDPNAAMFRKVDITETYLEPDVDRFPIVPFSLTTDETPLHVALKFLDTSAGRAFVPDMLRVLLTAGADPNAATPTAAERGETDGWNAVDVVYDSMRLNPDAPEPTACMQLLRDAGGELALLAEWAARDGYQG